VLSFVTPNYTTREVVPVSTKLAPLTVHSKVRIEKGCNALEITKGTHARVKAIEHMGAEYGHCVKVVLFFLNGFASGKTKTLYVRHQNRLEDACISLNNGNPSNKIEIIRWD